MTGVEPKCPEATDVRAGYAFVERFRTRAAVRALEALLDARDVSRLGRLGFEADRRARLLAYAGLRRGLSARAPIPPRGWRFRAGPGGRPELEGHRCAGVSFSLSHTRTAACWVTADLPAVGIDAERVRSLAESDALAPVLLTAAELREHNRRNPGSRPGRLALVWTLKEAVLKATGVGVTAARSEWLARLVADAGERLDAAWGRPTCEVRGWRFETTRPTPELVVSVAMRAGEHGGTAARGSGPVRPVRWQELLPDDLNGAAREIFHRG